MDATDKKILELLQTNGRITVKEITQTISLTAPAVKGNIVPGVVCQVTVEMLYHQTAYGKNLFVGIGNRHKL